MTFKIAALLPVLGLAALAGCVEFGDTGAVRDANALAIACDTDAAVSLSARTARGTGLAAELAELQQVVFLRDAGRRAEADRILAARYQRVEADADTRAETEKAVQTSLSDLRAERARQTGQQSCN
ncbi:hypothetical protein [Mangrovicoccus ximenensis]|uniref:hypothetical protein n=1 Tax=Mangrovicoccus ximenensis TaxID=1911570 RepID=UPI000D3B8C1E|nr:hypothetical protein [Mangrovicoccus ximenensis]